MIPPKKRKIRIVINKELSEEVGKSTFKDLGIVSRFVSDRGRIMSRDRTGLTAKMQRKMAKMVKRAREAGLLPFVSGL